MKNFLKLIFLSLIFFTSEVFAQDNVELVAQCAASSGDVTYLKDFIVKLDAGVPGGNPPTAKFSMVLSKNTQYRFSICTAPDSDGEAILQLFDMNVLQGSTYISATGKEFPFAIRIIPLHKHDDTDPQSPAESPDNRTERRGRLPFTIAGKNLHQPFQRL